VLFASNHVSIFDDPVVPMALFATGRRAALELLGLLAAACAAAWLSPERVPATPAWLAVGALALASAAGGARKTWWSLGDLVNFSGAGALGSRVAVRRGAPPGPLQRAALAIADPLIRGFMRSPVVKTVFVDRRPGEEAKRARARALDECLAIAERPEPLWVFFEGGRAKLPGVIGPARRGIGELVLLLRARGRDPLVVALHHRGLEGVFPRDTGRFVAGGQRLEVRWARCELDAQAAAPRLDAQAIADAVRARVAAVPPHDGETAP
jgi:hypothetical protein